MKNIDSKAPIVIDKITFLELFKKFITYRTVTKEKFEIRALSTLRIYNGKHLILFRFLSQKNMTNIKAIDFDMKIIKELSEWLARYEHEEGRYYSYNYIAKTQEACKMILQFGAANELLSSNPLQYLKIKKAKPAPPPYFTLEEIKALEEYQPQFSMASKAHAMAVIQLHSGLDYGDLPELKRSHTVMFNNRKFIVKKRHKNGNEAVIPVSETLDNYLEKYNYSVRLLSNQKYNATLKWIAKELGIQVNLTSKTLRKLFLMNKLNNQGVSMEAVSKMAGHKTIITTEMYYARPNINLIGKELDKLGL